MTDPRDRFAWHPEPELVGYGDAATSRAAMERLGADTWAAALDFLYDQAAERAMGDPAPYAELRAKFFGADRRPGPGARLPTPVAAILDEFRDRLAGGQMNAQHPRQFGYFTPPPLPISMMGELLAQMTNQGVDVWHAGPLATFVEEEVVRWLCDLVGFGPASFGLLTSGGVMANFMGMALARDIHLGRLLGAGRPPRGALLEGVRVYTSDQTHFSIGRALDLLGFPAETLVVIPSDERFRLHGAPVAEAVARDRRAGFTPFAIAGVAGSTNTGSVDLVGELADVAAAEDLWLHVDAAYGGGGPAVGPRWRAASPISSAPIRSPSTRTSGSSRPTTSAACWSATGRTSGRSSAAGRPSTTAAARRGRGVAGADGHDDHGDQLNFYKLSFEGTRRWRALKLWMSWKHLGTAGFGRLIEANDDLAALLARRCAESDDFEAIPETPELSVVCFRHLPGGRQAASTLPAAELDAHQDRLQRALEVSGEGWLTTTRLRGATWLRAGIVNYLTTEDDIDRLLATLRRLAADER